MNTLLYYPTISIPPGSWLRQAVLYWDIVGSIVPQTGPYYDPELEQPTYHIDLGDDIRFLSMEGEFRAFGPGLIMRQSEAKVLEFSSEFFDIIDGIKFQKLLRSDDMRQYYLVHQDKLSYHVERELDERLLFDKNKYEHDGYGKNWLRMEKHTALAYMSVLAKHLADSDPEPTTPGTDLRYYAKLNYEPIAPGSGVPCLSVAYANILPVPANSVSIASIVEFKRNRRDQLLRFRQIINEFEGVLLQAENVKELNDISLQYRERIELGVSDLSAVLGDAKLSTFFGALKTLIKPTSPTLWGTLAIASGQAQSLTSMPLNFLAPGLAATAMIEVGSYLVDQRNQKRAAIRDSPFAYLYEAEAKKIIK